MKGPLKKKGWLFSMLGLAMALVLVGCGSDSAFDDKVGGSAGTSLQVTVVPSSGSTDVAVNTMIVATFNKAMDTDTLNAGNVYLVDKNGTHISGDYYFGSGNTVMTFILSETLEANATYAFLIEKDVMAADGTLLGTDSRTTFTTGSATQLQVYVSPSEGETNVSTTGPITAVFNEPIETGTLNSTTVYLKDGLGNTVAGTIDYADTDGKHIMVFQPSAALTGNTTYTFTITGGVQSATGDSLDTPRVIHFTTGDYASVLSAAVFSFAPTAVTVDTNESDLLGGLLGGLLGVQPQVDALGVQGLAEIDLNTVDLLSALGNELNVSSVSELLNSDISLASLLELISEQVGSIGAAEAQQVVDALLAQINSAGLGDTQIALSELLQMPVSMLSLSIDDLNSIGGLSTARYNALSLLEGLNGALTPLIGTPIEVPLTIPGLTDANSSLRLQLVTAPTISVLEEGDTVYSSSTRVQLNLGIGGDLFGQLFSLLGSDATSPVKLQLYLELGSAEANLTKLSNEEIVMNVRNGLAKLYIGAIPEDQFFQNGSLSVDDFEPVSLLTLPGIVSIRVKGYAVGGTDTTEVRFLPVNVSQMQSVLAPVGSDVGSLLTSLVENLDVDILLFETIEVPVGDLLDALLSPLLNIVVPVLNPLLDSVSNLLGLYAGRADLTMQGLIRETH